MQFCEVTRCSFAKNLNIVTANFVTILVISHQRIKTLSFMGIFFVSLCNKK